MSQKVTFLELPVFSGVLPLASGYMEAVCRQDPLLNAHYSFEKLSLPVETEFREILTALERSDADVYGFSCYVWNARLVRRLLKALAEKKPKAQFILGGPQVMRQAARYLPADADNMFVCNGEGERTFANFLRVLHSPEKQFETVRGLSFYRNGRLITTPDEPRIENLAEVPSPFLEGMFEQGQYTWMLIETNRGCPFTCNYCFWGAATGGKVFKYDDERLQRELTWISQSGCWYLFIADANWGMLKRDVELSQFIADGQKLHGAPNSVYFCGSKNTPDRVAEITRIFHEAGMVACQSVALQTLNPETLRLVNRQNIRASTYTELQDTLNTHGIASFVELIWPLPGETLESFRDGVGQLCESGADHFHVYPLLLINNVELETKREEYGLVTVADRDPNSEAEVVVQTAQVDRQQYEQGSRFVYAVNALYTMHGLRGLAHYANSTGLMPYAQLFAKFVEFFQGKPTHSWTMFCETSIRKLDNVTFSNTGEGVHLIAHEQRDAFDALLSAFVSSLDLWNEPAAQLMFELDLVNRPYVYRNTPITQKRYKFRQIRVTEVLPGGYNIEIPEHLREHMVHHLTHSAMDQSTARFNVNHRRSQLPYMPGKSRHEHFMYCQDMSRRTRDIMPKWSVETICPAVEV